MTTKEFIRDDSRKLIMVEGFEDRLHKWRLSVSPKPSWREEDYTTAADKKLKRWQKTLSLFSRKINSFKGARTLEVGCGNGINSLLMSLQQVETVVGMDMRLRLFEKKKNSPQHQKLVLQVLEKQGFSGNIKEILAELPIHFVTMDATKMEFPDNSFDFIWSKSVLEHIIPVDKALAEMARVVRPGGMIYHSIDPFFWVRGCHYGGMVNLPWAHARLSLEEFRRFVIETEGEAMAEKRCLCLSSLNRFTLSRWRQVIEAAPLEILEWEEECNPFAEQLLEQNPEVEETLLPGVKEHDLIHGEIKVWLRKKPQGKSC